MADDWDAVLAWVSFVTVGSLVLMEQFGSLLPAAVAFAGAWWMGRPGERQRTSSSHSRD